MRFTVRLWRERPVGPWSAQVLQGGREGEDMLRRCRLNGIDAAKSEVWRQLASKFRGIPVEIDWVEE